MKERFQIYFDFTREGKAPSVYICDMQGAFGGSVVEVFEEPICLKKKWSWEEDDWKLGPMAETILLVMNQAHDNNLFPVQEH